MNDKNHFFFLCPQPPKHFTAAASLFLARLKAARLDGRKNGFCEVADGNCRTSLSYRLPTYRFYLPLFIR